MPIPKPPKECLEINKVGLTAPALTLRGPIPSRVAEESMPCMGNMGECVSGYQLGPAYVGEVLFPPHVTETRTFYSTEALFHFQPCLAT